MKKFKVAKINNLGKRKIIGGGNGGGGEDDWSVTDVLRKSVNCDDEY